MAAPHAALTRAKLQRLTAEFGGQSEVARLLDVDRSRVSRWLRGDEPDTANGATLDALEYVWARLLRTYKPSTAVKWLYGFNAHLGNRRPISLLRHGRVSEVIAAIEQHEAGSYA
jgi:transcriptional regulator with XRE-family HTH domain